MRSLVNEKEQIERAELDALLSSGFLGRTNNLVRLLSFVCEKYFEGSFDEIKEYSIAVQALGRPENFDPQVDTIVRVTAHALRKRLEDYYRSTGASHAIHICLPPGHYVPKFVHKDEGEASGELLAATVDGTELARRSALQENGHSLRHENELATQAPMLPSRHGDSLMSLKSPWVSRRVLEISAAAVIVAAATAGLVWYRSGRTASGEARVLPQTPTAVMANASSQALRAIAGEGRAPFVDRAGATWESDRFCTGGSSFSVAGRVIQGTVDSQLFSAGRHGLFHCRYPMPQGTYEVHLLFAETSGVLENTRNVVFSINGGPVVSLDVVDDAGGDDIATTKVFTDVKPEDDGAIHIDFAAPDSFLNAIEILPSTPHRMLPVRIFAGPSLYRDSSGNVWLPDRYFFGGRVNRFRKDLSKVPDGWLFEWHRYGHFHYVVPVAAGGKYTLKLYFLEHWFGDEGGSVGGVGSRLFDVSCNGRMLLQRFDIFSEAGTGPLIKTFNHIEPTGQGKIEIYFTPSMFNYPSLSAIEVLSE